MLLKNYSMRNNNYIIGIIIIILIIALIVTLYKNNTCEPCKLENERIKILEDKLESSSSSSSKTSKSNPEFKNDIEKYESIPVNKEVIVYPNPIPDQKSINALDRVYNPLRYPYKSDYFYDQGWYPDLQLPFQVIGGGYRRQPTLGGTQVPIYNPPVQIDISNTNIAPINITTRGPLGQPQQVGVMYKINGSENDVLPLFGRRRYPNDNKYEYYTLMGRYGSKVSVITKNKNDELGSNDVVFIKGSVEPYRVTVYENDSPQYIPYI
jgi:hypothetical protein